MPARHFDRDRVRAVRRAAEIPQSSVAAAVGVADSTVAGWELGSSAPDQEKLPALARVLNRGLDDLFPRPGRPDLRDLRCDAGLYRYEMAEVIGTRSDGPVAGAEQGVRRLRDKYVPALARVYGVTEAELREAEERSFSPAPEPENDEPIRGTSAPEAASSLADKITLLLERSYPKGGAPTDHEIATSVNDYAGSSVITASGVERLRTGAETDAAPVVLQGLAELLGVSALYFEPDEAVARQVYEGLRLMSAAKTGQVGRVRARGIKADGLPPGVLSMLNEIASELDKTEREADK
ncbi:helix-turn-helix domain-containing protein [Streptomyces albidoflavus]|uniref:DNA-binding protein n=1 Tax=Streptomyces wadayamensis TaxID=141454 RepID=A0ABR4S6X6_9ACTN|nr:MULTISPECIES: helix-turn-helix transcriptional regulator [Streptomyces]MYQ74015.1 helix-turn-helix domain-containing protein [Streptomyces sp. SID4934]KDR60950.1 DNA-binding protein [Streptomyces wadayamensis]QXQ25852.1 helix-turn-helix domain-containing protein [Streptomyces albidoflavus]QXQ31781.1 helix-turn-helix domain-containing protein [Streptomyces albidoflavus]SCE34962.1 Transcriptional regulator, contains XRE-family HTH domain [Streptomyces sp. ScaeMP-6W]